MKSIKKVLELVQIVSAIIIALAFGVLIGQTWMTVLDALEKVAR